MSSLPDPLAPPDLQVQGYEYMPLLGTRLFGSEFYTLALKNPRGGLAGQKLWWEAFQQKPAGSLPANEFSLCRLADFGTDIRAWNRAREVAMHGFILCSDGRYYHPVVVEIAMKAAQVRTKAREKKAGQRAAAAAAAPHPAADLRQDDATRRDHDVNHGEALASQPIDNARIAPECPQGRPGSVPAEGKVREGKKREGLRPSPAGDLFGGNIGGTEAPKANGSKRPTASKAPATLKPNTETSKPAKAAGKVPSSFKRSFWPKRAPPEPVTVDPAWQVNGWHIAGVMDHALDIVEVGENYWPGFAQVIYGALEQGADPDEHIYPVMYEAKKAGYETIRGVGFFVKLINDRIQTSKLRMAS